MKTKGFSPPTLVGGNVEIRTGVVTTKVYTARDIPIRSKAKEKAPARGLECKGLDNGSLLTVIDEISCKICKFLVLGNVSCKKSNTHH